MELIRGLHNLREQHRNCVATIGAFDGIHRGHQAVLNQLQVRARDLGLPSVVILFEPLPREYFAPQESPARLTTFAERFRQLEALGIDRLLLIYFTPSVRNMSAEQFIQQVFVEGLAARQIIVGDDFAFGRGREGNYELLRQIGLQCGYQVEDTETLVAAGERVSSTRIRAALENADFVEAEHLLGRPFSMSGRVVYGQQLGRQLGVPTANLAIRRHRSPMAGVYAVEVRGAREGWVQGIANVGTRPTIGDLTKAILEVHLFDFAGDIYGQHLEVVFRVKLRDEKRFSSVEELTDNIHADIASAKRYFEQR